MVVNFKAQGIPDTDHHNFVKAVKAFKNYNGWIGTFDVLYGGPR